MSITTTGYSLKRFEDILAEVQQSLITESGDPNIDLSDDSLLGILNNIWCLKLAEVHELAQALWSAGDLDTATGIQLDRLVERGRTYRQLPAYSTGFLQFTGNPSTPIPINTTVKDLEGLTVNTTVSGILNLDSVYSCKTSVTVKNSTMYSLTVNGITYNYFSSAAATTSEIITNLTNILNAGNAVIAEVVNGDTLVITRKSADYNLVVGQGIVVTSITKSIRAVSTTTGPLQFEAGSLTTLVVPISGVTVTNTSDFVVGRNLETDSELRSRFKNTRAGQGKATLPAIFTAVSNVNGVTNLTVDENVTEVTNSDGLPAKSFEVTVSGGSDDIIAQTIFDVKPAGIRSHGNTTSEVLDTTGKKHTIQFTRPINAYIHVLVEYFTYSEEVLPANADSLIKDQIVAYGNTLVIGKDVVPERFYGSIYANIAGVGNMTIRMGRTINPFDTPTYSGNVINISAKETPVFEASRITVVRT